MGIRFEKDTILNWIDEMGKFLRLLTDSYDAFDKEKEPVDIEGGYMDFFKKDRSFFQEANLQQIDRFLDSLEIEQIRPLAQLLMYDGLLNQDQLLLIMSKHLFERNMQKTGAFSFEDYGYLAKIDKEL